MTRSPEQLPLELDPLDLMTAAAIYSRADQALLEKLREDRRVERKPAGTHGQVVGDYVCSKLTVARWRLSRSAAGSSIRTSSIWPPSSSSATASAGDGPR